MTVKAQFPDEQTAAGDSARQEDAFREWVTADGSSGFPAARGRYQLYVSLACPWAHRTIIVRGLKALEDVIGMTVVEPIRDDRGWRFALGASKYVYKSPFKTALDLCFRLVKSKAKTRRRFYGSDVILEQSRDYIFTDAKEKNPCCFRRSFIIAGSSALAGCGGIATSQLPGMAG